jgi:uncharacterized protein YjbI with pentapeptide repeats
MSANGVPSRRGLRKLSPDLISKARDETAAQVTRLGLTFLGTTAFCILSLLSPDSALLGGSEKINLPLFAGPVSFFGFILLGPAVLIVLRIYLQIYVEHSERLDRLARSMSTVRAPTLVPLQNPLIRFFSGLLFYLLLPVVLMAFARKAAAFPNWGAGLFGVAVAVIASHVMLPFRRLSWRSRALLSAGVGALSCAMIFGFGPPRRPFDLFHANLSGQYLPEVDLSEAVLDRANLNGADLGGVHLNGADLSGARLSGAYLNRADLSGKTNLINAILTDANLSEAKLIGATLFFADLSGANLSDADLSGAKLSDPRLILSGVRVFGTRPIEANLKGADLSGANLSDADLSGVINLTQTQLDGACGNSDTKLPNGLTIKPCAPTRRSR